ncbi:hypothetical protein ACOMHN_004714 [Nucella lapillus]
MMKTKLCPGGESKEMIHLVFLQAKAVETVCSSQQQYDTNVAPQHTVWGLPHTSTVPRHELSSTAGWNLGLHWDEPPAGASVHTGYTRAGRSVRVHV